MSSARISILWQKHAYSRIVGEAFADVRGVGRFSIRRSKSDPSYFTLKLNGSHICSGVEPARLKLDAQRVVEEKMREGSSDE